MKHPSFKSFTRRYFLAFSGLWTTVRGQLAESPESTMAMANGRLWLKINDIERLAFLAGCRDALWWSGLQYQDYAKIPDQIKFPQLEGMETRKELDLFYSEGANAPIPIVMAIRYVRRKAAGDSPEQLSDMLSSFRRSSH